MCADNRRMGDAASSVDEHVTAIDVHAHAMPLRLLESLEQRGLADLSRADAGIVVLDPSVSGVGKDTPLPLARSQYNPGTRLQEMDQAGVTIHAVSMPPFLYCSNSEDRQLVSTVITHGNNELAEYVAGGGNRLYGLGSVPLGLPDGAQEAQRCLDDLGLTASRSAPEAPVRISTTRSTTICGHCSPNETRSCSCIPAASPTSTASGISIFRSSSGIRWRRRSASLG